MTEKNKKRFMGIIDPRSKDVESQIDALAHKLAVDTKVRYNREHGIVDKELETEWDMINKGLK